MAFCKVCACGEIITFERRLGFPEECPSCGRRTVDFLTYSEEDPMVLELVQRAQAAFRKEDGPEDLIVREREREKKEGGIGNGGSCPGKQYVLQLQSGERIRIPEEGGIVGRTGIGAAQLAEYASVSRQHLRVRPRRNLGVLVEDLSSYGTFVDGKKIEKNIPVLVPLHGKITLCNVELTLEAEE